MAVSKDTDYSSLAVKSELAPGVLGSASIAGVQVGLGITTRGLKDSLVIALGIAIGIVGIAMVFAGTKTAKTALNIASTVAAPASALVKGAVK